ncbi:MAG TPA: hypothetical protein DCZ43_12375, partial [candidate division Zixibacteria bacterium]|nr:hypothetical protein [candidate division Zixibacteria bacterium]
MSSISENNATEKGFFWLFLSFVFKWRRLLLVNTLIAVVFTFIVMLFMPNWYKSTTTILPPEKESGLGFGASLLPSSLGSLLGGSGMSLPGLASPSDLYASIAKSRAVCMAVIEKYNLKTVFDTEFDEQAIDELMGRTSILVEPDGIITISYEDTDQNRAAAVTNSLAEELNRVNRENMASKAHAMREFVEQRLTETISDLAAAEEAYKNFQEIHFAVSLDEQVKAVIGAVAELRGQLAVSEIELGVMKKSLSPTNLTYQEQEYKIEQIKDQLSKLE